MIAFLAIVLLALSALASAAPAAQAPAAAAPATAPKPAPVPNPCTPLFKKFAIVMPEVVDSCEEFLKSKGKGACLPPVLYRRPFELKTDAKGIVIAGFNIKSPEDKGLKAYQTKDLGSLQSRLLVDKFGNLSGLPVEIFDYMKEEFENKAKNPTSSVWKQRKWYLTRLDKDEIDGEEDAKASGVGDCPLYEILPPGSSFKIYVTACAVGVVNVDKLPCAKPPDNKPPSRAVELGDINEEDHDETVSRDEEDEKDATSEADDQDPQGLKLRLPEEVADDASAAVDGDKPVERPAAPAAAPKPFPNPCTPLWKPKAIITKAMESSCRSFLKSVGKESCRADVKYYRPFLLEQKSGKIYIKEIEINPAFSGNDVLVYQRVGNTSGLAPEMFDYLRADLQNEKSFLKWAFWKNRKWTVTKIGTKNIENYAIDGKSRIECDSLDVLPPKVGSRDYPYKVRIDSCLLGYVVKRGCTTLPSIALAPAAEPPAKGSVEGEMRDRAAERWGI
ncbi:hypothetical protein HDU96_007083 [Phlyctochytrium bullatum]|nr:hypothetical protein HDU96_007083 [Phlyctochytrium bullatum]